MENGKLTIKQVIAKLVKRENLTRAQASDLMNDILEGHATPAQIGSIATALMMKEETIDEIAGLADAMRSKCDRVETERDGLIDIVGTGGDGSNTFNISTATAIVVAAGGIRVAKHGNRAASSKSGSADVLEALGVNIGLNSAQVAECLDSVGIGFMFAQLHHQSLKHAAGPRKELGVRTVFNILGPLTNPAGADRQLLGVFDRSKTEIVTMVLHELQIKRAFVVSSHDGLDEISISAPTQITELNEGKIRTFDITPDDFGLRQHPLSEVAGGTPEENAEIIRRILKGERGAYRDIVLANAAASFYLAGKCKTLQEGVKIAADLIDSGKAYEKLQDLIKFTGAISHVS
ncbi:anthranilate phosphoribosyltransferase [Ferviditalea candida]|uniref:Anthranilate phosphoribosyltransferase n=1 Tax=Ferviditalea candida TaxID=3108399 RepID=A0ABU5ZPV7_9BACL|nr:anthranilate phosphoribosyltransferase [Paenibacillaceae bacterium T2]